MSPEPRRMAPAAPQRSAHDSERLDDHGQRAGRAEGLVIRAKCAPFFRRILYGLDPASPLLSNFAEGSCPAGRHYCRIMPNGDVTACPYMPVVAGNLRRIPSASCGGSRASSMTCAVGSLGGRCGSCEFSRICGGCRCRAYATFGDYLAEDPACAYRPGAYGGRVIDLPVHQTFGMRAEATLTWTVDAHARLKQVPGFARGMVVAGVERYARERGIAVITPELMQEVRQRVAGRVPLFARRATCKDTGPSGRRGVRGGCAAPAAHSPAPEPNVHDPAHGGDPSRGKGGVGKSTLTSNLAAVLAEDGARVAVLDADLNGPSLAKMLGVRGASLHIGPRGLEPPVGPRGIKVLSMDHLLPRDEAPVQWKAPTQEGNFVWRASAEAAALREFLSDTAWGPLEFLLIDLAPGTDKIASLASLLPRIGAAVVVTIPTEVSHLTVENRPPRHGAVGRLDGRGYCPNMATHRCAHRGTRTGCFRGRTRPSWPGDGAVSGRVPFDPRLAVVADRGVPYIRQEPGAPCAAAVRAVASGPGSSVAAGSGKPRRPSRSMEGRNRRN